ncbi:MAG: T9SS type A sorting domain-containing protein [bacterium]|nr:T9SS type A sorting domain-containing protein [bacterium]
MKNYASAILVVFGLTVLLSTSALGQSPFVATSGYYGPPVVLNGDPFMGGYTGIQINVPQNVLITNVRVRINVSCPDNSRFGTFITDPGGFARANLAHWRNGSLSGQDFSNTVFDESAPVSIYSGTAPYLGFYNTGFGELSMMNGLMSGGDWGVSIEYWAMGSVTLNSVELEINDGAVLPVEMTSFNAVGADKQVFLHWNTESETDNAHFNLYRSTMESQRGELLAQLDGLQNSATGREYNYTDNRVLNGQTYYYRIADVSMNGVETIHPFVVMATPSENALGVIPIKYTLSQNFPNPFNPSTQITYGISQAGNVHLTVFDAMGRELKTLVNGYQSPNTYKITFNAENLPSGTYYYSLSTKGFSTTKKMVFMK